MKKKLRKTAMCILILVFAVSTALSLRQFRDNAGGESAYQGAMEIAMNGPKEEIPEGTEAVATEPAAEPVTCWKPAPVTDDPMMEEMAQINIAALREENEDVLGWIRIPDTKVDYPLMQGEDNDFYLNHTWDKQPNSVGSIFLEHLNSPDLTDYNTIFYGHNMKNDSMFGQLENYALQHYRQAHPYVYIATADGVYRYEIFAFFRAEVDGLAYSLNILQDRTKEDFLQLSRDSAWYDTGIVPELTDRILTLSTCSGANYAHRYVVQARLPMVEVTK